MNASVVQAPCATNTKNRVNP